MGFLSAISRWGNSPKDKLRALRPNTYDAPTLTDIEKIELVRHDLFVKTCVKTVAHHLSRLNWTVESTNKIDKEDWQFKFWNNFLEYRGKKIIRDMYSQAWAYNTAYAYAPLEPDTSVFTVPKNLTVIPMKGVSDNKNSIYYNNFKYDKAELMTWQMSMDDSYKDSLELFEHCNHLRVLYKSEARARVIHVLGIHWLEWISTDTAPTKQDYEYRDDWVKALGSSELVAGGCKGWKPSVQFGNPQVSAEEEINHAKDAVLAYFGLQWLSAGTWTSGTRASVELQVKSYLDDLDGLADSLQYELQRYSEYVAVSNGMSGTTVKFRHSTPVVTPPVDEYINAVAQIKSLNLSTEEMQEVYPRLNLPVPKEESNKQVVPPAIQALLASPMSLKTCIDAGIVPKAYLQKVLGIPEEYINEVEALPEPTTEMMVVDDEQPKSDLSGLQNHVLNNKTLESYRLKSEQGFLTCVNQAREHKAWKFDLSGSSTIAGSLGIQATDLAKIFNAYKTDFQTAIYALRRQTPSVDYEKETFANIWANMETHIKTLMKGLGK